MLIPDSRRVAFPTGCRRVSIGPRSLGWIESQRQSDERRFDHCRVRLDFGRALAGEWGPAGVQVNAIAPGYISTDNTTDLRADPVREAAIRDRIPAGRWGRPEDVVGAAVFLASAAADYVNGHVLAVDGGWLAR